MGKCAYDYLNTLIDNEKSQAKKLYYLIAKFVVRIVAGKRMTQEEYESKRNKLEEEIIKQDNLASFWEKSFKDARERDILYLSPRGKWSGFFALNVARKHRRLLIERKSLELRANFYGLDCELNRQ